MAIYEFTHRVTNRIVGYGHGDNEYSALEMMCRQVGLCDNRIRMLLKHQRLSEADAASMLNTLQNLFNG